MAHRKFLKLSGNGNDFIYFPESEGKFLNQELVTKLCHRQLGIGADGILIKEAHPTHAFFMRIFNADGGEADMCANGARCLLSLEKPEKMVSFETRAGIFYGRYQDQIWWLKMTKIADQNLIDLDFIPVQGRKFYVNTGVPHVVIEVSNLDKKSLRPLAEMIRHHQNFVKGTNVNFVKVVDLKNKKFEVLSFERGVEDFTLSCGTGNSAVAIAYADWENISGKIEIKTEGGLQWVDFNPASNELWYGGKIETVFEGMIEC